MRDPLTRKFDFHHDELIDYLTSLQPEREWVWDLQRAETAEINLRLTSLCCKLPSSLGPRSRWPQCIKRFVRASVSRCSYLFRSDGRLREESTGRRKGRPETSAETVCS